MENKRFYCCLILTVIFMPVLAQLKTEPDGFKWQLFEDNGYYGVKNAAKNVVITSDYDQIECLDTFFVVKKGIYKGIYQRNGKCILPANKYTSIKINKKHPHSPFILFRSQGWSAMDHYGKVLIPEDKYEFIGFQDDEEGNYHFICSKNNYCGVYELDGNQVFAPNKYSSLYRTGNKKSGYYYSFTIYGFGSGVCDSFGKELIRTKYQQTFLRTNYIGKPDYYEIRNAGNKGKLNLDGDIITEPSSDDYMWYLYVTENKLYSFEIIYDGKKNKYGVRDKATKKTIVPYDYDFVYENALGKYIGVRKGQYLGLYDTDGKCVLSPDKYYIAGECGISNLLFASKDGLSALLDINGKELLPPLYASIEGKSYSNITVVYAQNKEGKNCAYKYNNGSISQIFQHLYDGIGMLTAPFDEHLAVGIYVEINGRHGVCNLQGKEIIPPIYTKVNAYGTKDNFYFMVHNGKKKGLIDRNGKVVISSELFDNIEIEDNGYIIASNNFQTCKFDLTGKLISNNKEESDRDAYIVQADKEFEQANYKKAAQLYGEAIKIRGSAEIFFNEGVSYYNIENYEKAINDFNKCLMMFPSKNLIDRSKELISKSRQYQAQIKLEKAERRRNLAANILGLVVGVANAYVQTKMYQNFQRSTNIKTSGSFQRDTSYDYLVDPNYIWQQVQNQNWTEYMTMTNGGQTMSYDQWYANVKAPAIQTTSGNSVSSVNSSSSSSYSSTSFSSGSMCRLCAGSGDCKSCDGRGYFFNQYDLTKKVLCPSCESNHNGKCKYCHGTGSR